MAALLEMPENRVVDLRKVSAADVAPLLSEEAAAWRNSLDWDLQSATGLVRRFVDMQALNGFALIEGTRPIGYSYYIRDGKKGLIGDLYVMAAERTPERENALLEATLEALWRSPGVHRVEAQLLLFGATRLSAQEQRRMPFAHWLQAYPRWFMEAPAADAFQLAAREPVGIAIAPWLEAKQDDSARLVAAAYRGHVDSDINDQYRSPAGARRFLSNIVQYPGCGTFFAPASFAAVASGNAAVASGNAAVASGGAAGASSNDSRGALCGISLASLVAERTGHITQICVAPSHRGTGVGYALLRRSLRALAEHGCSRVSLTVTAANQDAVRLYQRMGFTLRREFAAYVWDSSEPAKLA
jgi:GNAT superfamily N-acetyltransferase